MDRIPSASLTKEATRRFLVRYGETGHSFEIRLQSSWRKFVIAFLLLLLGLFGTLCWVTWNLARGFPLAWYEERRQAGLQDRLVAVSGEMKGMGHLVGAVDTQAVLVAARFGVPWQSRGDAVSLAPSNLLDRLFPEETPSLALAREAQALDRRLLGRVTLLQAGQEAGLKCAKLWEGTPSIYPMRGKFSSPFGYRSNPVTGIYQLHAGVDLTNSIGTPIVAPAAGKVIEDEYSPSYGNTVVLKHVNGVSTRYAHLNQSRVKLGQVLKRGELIGTMGNTGRSTGPHLHYEVHVGASPVNPMQWILPTVLSP
ncbi:MAG: hypothetical protein RL318_2276 [Fibrobacterota bacterium]|jgi:hypothetical protein